MFNIFRKIQAYKLDHKEGQETAPDFKMLLDTSEAFLWESIILPEWILAIGNIL